MFIDIVYKYNSKRSDYLYITYLQLKIRPLNSVYWYILYIQGGLQIVHTLYNDMCMLFCSHPV
jgi:hypothetical protein